MNYFEDIRRDVNNPCEICKWMTTVDANEEPCCYCENYSNEETPEDFDYEKLRKEKLGY